MHSTSTNTDTWPVGVKLVMAIQSSLDAFELPNALFLANMLVACMPQSEDARYWLARCYMAQGHPSAAKAILKGCSSLTGRFLFARACIEVLELELALNALVDRIDGHEIVHILEDNQENTSVLMVEPPSRSSIFLVIGNVYQRTNRPKLACHCFKRALSLNPLLWSAYESLCQLGALSADETPDSLFKEDAAGAALVSLINHRPCSLFLRSDTPTFAPSNVTVTIDGQSKINKLTDSDTCGRMSENRKRPRSLTPDHYNTRLQTSGVPAKRPTIQCTHNKTNVSIPEPDHSSSRLQHHIVSQTTSTLEPSSLPSLPVSTTPSAVLSPDIIASRANGRVTDSTANISHYDTLGPAPNLSTSITDGLSTIVEYFRASAGFFHALRWRRRLLTRPGAISKLPTPLQNTAMAHRIIAMAYAEERNDLPALNHFARAHTLTPWDPKGMDWYSTVLWRNDNRAQLLALSTTLNDLVPSAPESLVVLGNLASMDKQHDKAIDLFRRSAIAGASRGYGYAWGVCGHEYLDNEKHVEAVDAFRRALMVEPELVTAWMGLGLAYECLEKHDIALFHYKKAADLSGTGHVLAHVGYSLELQGKLEEAVVILEEAMKMCPGRNPSINLRLAAVTLKLGKYDYALTLLKQLQGSYPHEADAYYLLAYAHHALGDKDASLKALVDAQACLTNTPAVLRTLISRIDMDMEIDLNTVLETCQSSLTTITRALTSTDIQGVSSYV